MASHTVMHIVTVALIISCVAGQEAREVSDTYRHDYFMEEQDSGKRSI